MSMTTQMLSLAQSAVTGVSTMNVHKELGPASCDVYARIDEYDVSLVKSETDEIAYKLYINVLL